MVAKNPQAPARSPLAAALALAGAGLSQLAFWAPVLFALAFFSQIAFKGLKPALAEERRLAGEEQRLRAVHEELVTEQDELADQLEAFDDPIYLERLRQLGLARDRAPVLVDSPTPYSTGGQPGGAGTSGGSPAPSPAGGTAGGPAVR
jgi:hypothetical protein